MDPEQAYNEIMGEPLPDYEELLQYEHERRIRNPIVFHCERIASLERERQLELEVMGDRELLEVIRGALAEERRLLLAAMLEGE